MPDLLWSGHDVPETVAAAAVSPDQIIHIFIHSLRIGQGVKGRRRHAHCRGCLVHIPRADPGRSGSACRTDGTSAHHCHGSVFREGSFAVSGGNNLAPVIRHDNRHPDHLRPAVFCSSSIASRCTCCGQMSGGGANDERRNANIGSNSGKRHRRPV
jgi:hypothetical protein